MESVVFRAVIRAFEKAGWKYARVPEREVVESSFETHHTRLSLHVQAFEEIGAVSVVVESANAVSQEKCARLAELLMRANEQLTVGGFEMLWDSGLALFRATNLFDKQRVDEDVVVAMVHSALAEMDRLTPFVAILEGTAVEDLADLDLVRMLRREDLLPPTGDEDSGLVLGEDDV